MQAAILDNDDVAGLHLTPFSKLDLAVDPDPPGGDQRLGLAAALDTTGQLQHLSQVDRAIADLAGSACRLVHHERNLVGVPVVRPRTRSFPLAGGSIPVPNFLIASLHRTRHAQAAKSGW